MADSKTVLLQQITCLCRDGCDLIDLAPQHRSKQRVVSGPFDEENFELNGIARGLDRR